MNPNNSLQSHVEDIPDVPHGDWESLPIDDPVCVFIQENLWDRSNPPQAWQAARLSQATYVYREEHSQWAITAKFYAQKKGDVAHEYALREVEMIERARQAGLVHPEGWAVEPLAVWKGVLFLEYVPGLTLEDIIAVRRSRPGELGRGLNQAASFLASLHQRLEQPDAENNFQDRLNYIDKILNTLAKYGVLQDNPIVVSGIRRQIEHWAQKANMCNYTPVWIHGDVTTSNFIYPWEGGMAAIDWERAKLADPASDLGRLMAEVSHSISQHGGNVAEAQPFIRQVESAYCQTLSKQADCQNFLERVRFYQALSTLRIARNGWVSRLDRLGLVAQAMALLS